MRCNHNIDNVRLSLSELLERALNQEDEISLKYPCNKCLERTWGLYGAMLCYIIEIDPFIRVTTTKHAIRLYRFRDILKDGLNKIRLGLGH